MLDRVIIPVIIGGGSGSRLWPLSRYTHPKPYVRLPDGTTLIGKTYERAAKFPDVENIYTVTNHEHFFLANDCYEETGVKNIQNHFILEPMGRNTAPAIAAAVLHAQQVHGDDAILVVLPADHLIEAGDELIAAFEEARLEAIVGNIVTFGIKPTTPETGYGYIELKNGVFSKFVEKPDLETSKQYVLSGDHFWNSGMFCFTAKTMIEAMEQHCPDVLDAVKTCFAESNSQEEPRGNVTRLDEDLFEAVPNISIDYAVMEKATNISCITTDFGWSDVGSWLAYSGFFPLDDNGNRHTGDVMSVKSQDCIVDAKSRFVGLVGVEDLIVIDTPDALLIADKNNCQDVKKVFSELHGQNHDAALLHRTVHRPWGTYTILEEGERFKVKRITVRPGASLSLQSHNHRSEHWVVVSGIAKVINGDSEITLVPNESTYIPCGYRHRMDNPGILPLVLIEVQSGEYLGEDDIIRYDDIYDRV